MPEVRTHYDNLKVSRNAPIEVVTAAYRSLAQKYHPDRNIGNPDCTRIMAILNASFEVLRDPKKRAEHDRWIDDQESGSTERTHVPTSNKAEPKSRPVPEVTIKKFSLTAETFAWKNKIFQISEIKNLRFDRVLTTQKMNFAKVGEAHSASLHVTMDSGTKVVVSIDESTILMGWNRDKSDELGQLANAYRFLGQQTFQKRISPYLKQIEAYGYFKHDECKFYPKSKIIFRDQEFTLKDSTFLKGYGYVELQKKERGFLDKVKRGVSLTKIPQFNTQTDSDVIFSLLHHFLSLQWE